MSIYLHECNNVSTIKGINEWGFQMYALEIIIKDNFNPHSVNKGDILSVYVYKLYSSLL